MDSLWEPNSEYELLDVPGTQDLQIAVIPELKRRQNQEGNGSRYQEWTISFDPITFLTPLELYGWFSETERETGRDIGNQLFTSACIRHSELIIVIPNGQHLVKLEGNLATGRRLSKVTVQRWSRINGTKIPIQTNLFEDCLVTGVQQYLDMIIARMRINKKEVACLAFNQHGKPTGVGTYKVDFTQNKVSLSRQTSFSILPF